MNETGAMLDRRCRLCGQALPARSTFCPQCGASTEQAAGDDPLLDRLRALFGRDLQVEREIGRGGTAVVFAAYDPVLERRVAVKILLPDLATADMNERFQREARTVAALQHPNVVTVYGVRTDGDVSAIVMQFVEGRSLDAVLRETPRLPLAVAGLVLAQVAAGLQHAHDRGIIHRDMKPGNILLANDGLAVVSDFGIARREGSARLTASGIMMGTVAYMSPEQIAGATVGPASDQYSFGVLAFELLAGQRVFTGTPAQILSAHRNVAPRPLTDLRPDLPPAIVSCVARLLEKRPEARYLNLKDIQRVFLTLVPDEAAAATHIVSISQARDAARPGVNHAVPADAASPSPRDAAPMEIAAPTVDGRRRRRAWSFGVAALLVVSVSLVATQWMSGRKRSPATEVPSSVAPPTAVPRATDRAAPAVDFLAVQAARPVKDRRDSPPASVAAPSSSTVQVTSPSVSRDTAATTSTPVVSSETKPVVGAEPSTAPNSNTVPAPSASPTTTAASTATLAEARAVAREFVTLCNQRRWREIDGLGFFAGEPELRAEIVRLVRNAPDFAAGFERVASSPRASREGFVTDFVVDLEWRGGRRLLLIRVQALQEKGVWRLAAFGVSPAE